jgi:hypothetical protein
MKSVGSRSRYPCRSRGRHDSSSVGLVARDLREPTSTAQEHDTSIYRNIRRFLSSVGKKTTNLQANIGQVAPDRAILQDLFPDTVGDVKE